jgi:hypothetical protein
VKLEFDPFMTKNLTAIATLFACGVVIPGCTRGVNGGNPAVALANTNGTTVIFSTSEESVLSAITNAFERSEINPMGYRGMNLESVTEADIISASLKTNNLVLFPLIGPIATVPIRGRIEKWVPYTACFNITVSYVDTSLTRVTVRTVFSYVIDGRELGVHGGWANHSRAVPGIQQEEDSVLVSISNALARVVRISE